MPYYGDLIMSELKKDLIKLVYGTARIAKGEEHVITEDHSINDVLRWVVEQLQGDKSEVEFLLKNMD